MRPYCLVIGASLLLACAAQAQLTSGLVSYYKEDVQNGQQHPDSVGSNNGPETGSVGFTSSGLINGASLFSGSNSTSSPRVGSTIAGIGTWTQGAISVWVRPVVYSSTNNLSILQVQESGTFGHRWLYIDPNSRNVVWHIGMGIGSANVASGITISDTAWYHIVAMWNRTNNTATLYVNGFFQGTVNVQAWGPTSNNFFWGAGFNGFGTDGAIDEVGVWNRVLTASEISDLYNGGAGSSYPFPPPTYSISGVITDDLGSPLSNVAVGLSTGATTTTAGNGAYQFSQLTNGSYTVTPSQSGFTFNPSSRNVNISGSSVTNANFTRNAPPPQTYTVGGVVRTSGGTGVPNVQLTLSTGASAFSAQDGSYAFLEIPNGSYTVTPSQSGSTFTPASRNFQVSGAPVTGLDFTRAAACSPTLSVQSVTAPTAGQTATITVTIAAGCAWTATESLSWLNITSGGSGNGSGTVVLQIDANNTGASRSGTVTIAGVAVTVTQGSCSLSQTSATFSSGAATGEVSVTGVCAFTASSASSFLSITSGATGTAPGVVRYAVQAYTGGTSPRVGTLTIAGVSFTVTQNPTPACTFQLVPASATVPASGGSGSFQVSATAGCGWNASTSADWITLSSGASGSLDGSVSFVASSNRGGERTAAINVAGQMFTVVQQAGTSCPVTLEPRNATFESTGSDQAIVRVNSPCTWTATSNASFLTILSGATGDGPGLVTYRVQAATAARSGALTIAGQTFTVSQRAPVCEFSLSSTSEVIATSGGSVVVTVSTSPACLSQVAVSNLPSWLSVASLTAPSGSGVNLTITAVANPGVERRASLRVAGLDLTIIQPAAGPFSCRTRAVSAIPDVRIEGRSELVSDLVLECSGQSAEALTGDVLVTFNTNFTSKLLGLATEALLVQGDPASPQLGVTAFQGTAAGNNAVRFGGIPLATAGDNPVKTVRLTNVRLDAALGAATTADLTARVVITSPSRPIPVESPVRTVARRLASFSTTIGAVTTVSGGFRVPVTFQEILSNAFRPRTAENGTTLANVEQVGFADSGTRLVVKIRGLGAGARVQAPVYPDSGQSAQLVSHDPSGSGIGLLSGSASNPLLDVPILGGEATITWEILNGNANVSEAHIFSIVVSDATGISSRLTPSLGPLSSTVQTLARRPVPAFFVPTLLTTRAPAIRAVNAAAATTGISNALRRAPAGNRMVTLAVTVTCDAPGGCEDPSARGNTSAGSSFQTCASDSAESCTGSGRDFVIDFPRMGQGEAVSAIIGTELSGDAPGGSNFRYSVRTSSELSTAVSEVEQCLASTGVLPAPPPGGSQGSIDIYSCGAWSFNSPVPWITFSPSSGSGNGVVQYTIAPNDTGSPRDVSFTLPGGGQVSIVQQPRSSLVGLGLVPVTPCRVADTRAGSGFTGLFGTPSIVGGDSREIPVRQSGCGIPTSARAYSLNFTVVPNGSSLAFITAWPCGEVRPLASTLNSFEGKIVANAAIIPAGVNGSVCVFASDATELIVDVNGYFAPF